MNWALTISINRVLRLSLQSLLNGSGLVNSGTLNLLQCYGNANKKGTAIDYGDLHLIYS